MGVRSELALAEEAGMRLVPDTGSEPWVTRLEPPHPGHVSMAAGALLAITASRRHAYMIAYTLDDARLLNNGETGSVVDSELRDRFALELDGGVSEFIHPNEFGGYDVDFARLAEIAHEFFAPALKEAYLKGHDAGFAAANVDDPWATEDEISEALPDWERELLESKQPADTGLSDLVALIEQELDLAHSGEGYEPKAVAEQIVKDRVAPVLAERDAEIERLHAQVKLLAEACQRSAYTDKDLIAREAQIRDLIRELDLAVATRRQYAEERDEAIHKLNDAHLKAVYLAAELEREHSSRQDWATEAMRLDGVAEKFRSHESDLVQRLINDQEGAAAMIADLYRDRQLLLWLHAEAMWALGQAGDYIRATRPVTEASEQAEPHRCTETNEHGQRCRKGKAMPHHHVFDDGAVSPATPAEPRPRITFIDHEDVVHVWDWGGLGWVVDQPGGDQ